MDYKFAVHAKRCLGISYAYLQPGASLNDVWRGVSEYAAVQFQVPEGSIVCGYVYLKHKQGKVEYWSTAVPPASAGSKLTLDAADKSALLNATALPPPQLAGSVSAPKTLEALLDERDAALEARVEARLQERYSAVQGHLITLRG